MAKEALNEMKMLVESFIRSKDSEGFTEPVDWEGLQLYDYPQLIRQPMDLGTVKAKLTAGEYYSAAECAADVKLIWDNCQKYNSEDSVFYKAAQKLSDKFEARYAKVNNKDAMRDIPEDQPIPLEDKTRFSMNVYQLAREELGKFIEAIDQRCPDSIERYADDELEVNVDVIEPRHFRYLDQMVQKWLPDPDKAGPSSKKGKKASGANAKRQRAA